VARRDYEAAIEEHRQKLHRILDRRGVVQMKRLYQDAHAELERKLTAVAGRKATMTSFQQKLLLLQVKHGQQDISKRMTKGLSAASADAQVESLHSLTKTVSRAAPQFRGAQVSLPIEEAARFRGIIDKRRTSLLQAHATSMSTHSARVVKKMETELSNSLMSGESNDEAIQRVVGVADVEWWQAERIVKTELAWAYNSTQADGIAASAEAVPGLMMRWTENCDDTSSAPLDDRVGVDSIAMHGQVAKPNGGMFTCPPTAPLPDAKGQTRVSDSLSGESWAFPPNRPNDRAALSPWHPDWGVPGWVWRGRRVPVTSVR